VAAAIGSPQPEEPAVVATTELPRRRPVIATRRFRNPSIRPGQAMTTFNRIFSTERLLQIIVILAATVAMKLMG